MGHSFKPGDILVSIRGYEQTNADFYQVISITPKMINVRKIESHGFEHGNTYTGTVKPLKNNFIGAPFRRLVYNAYGVEKIAINDIKSAGLWDGKPVKTSSYA